MVNNCRAMGPDHNIEDREVASNEMGGRMSKISMTPREGNNYSLTFFPAISFVLVFDPWRAL